MVSTRDGTSAGSREAPEHSGVAGAAEHAVTGVESTPMATRCSSKR